MSMYHSYFADDRSYERMFNKLKAVEARLADDSKDLADELREFRYKVNTILVEGKDMPTPWHRQMPKVIALGNHLVAEGKIDTTKELLYFFEKPWKYQNEWKEFINA